MSIADIDNDRLVTRMLPTAAALTVAVDEHDETLAHSLLQDLDARELQALAVVLAAHVDPDKPFRARGPVNVVRTAVRICSARYRIPEHQVLTSRDRVAIEARAVAAYVGKLAGLSSIAVGAQINRDHTTVLNAWGRVGSNPRLRAIANEIAEQLGFPTRAVDDGEDLAS